VKWLVSIAAAAVWCGQSPIADAPLQAGRIQIVVPELASNSGQVRIWVHSRNTFVRANLEKRDDAESIQRGTAKIEKRQAVWLSDPLPLGDYAIAVHHDANGDGTINFGKVLPAEALGYSNYDEAIAAYPEFDTARVTLDAPVLEVRVEAFMQGRLFRRRLKE